MKLIDDLRKQIGKIMFVHQIGSTFAPKGVLTSVEEDFIILDDLRIPFTSIASYKEATR